MRTAIKLKKSLHLRLQSFVAWTESVLWPESCLWVVPVWTSCLNSLQWTFSPPHKTKSGAEVHFGFSPKLSGDIKVDTTLRHQNVTTWTGGQAMGGGRLVLSTTMMTTRRMRRMVPVWLIQVASLSRRAAQKHKHKRKVLKIWIAPQCDSLGYREEGVTIFWGLIAPSESPLCLPGNMVILLNVGK